MRTRILLLTLTAILGIGAFLFSYALLPWPSTAIPEARAGVRRVTTASELQSALNAAQPGDEIVLADGIYTGQFTINGNSGTASNSITVRAENRHKAILERTVGCSDSGALEISRNYWTIKDLRFRNQNSVAHV